MYYLEIPIYQNTIFLILKFFSTCINKRFFLSIHVFRPVEYKSDANICRLEPEKFYNPEKSRIMRGFQIR